jgi:uncharacterized 2Fe-2S/4Fe-4S cluster protein (DUF4445 family)
MTNSQQDHLVVFQPSGRQGQLPAGTTLLEAARRLGVDVDSICGGRQTCGKCKVLVETGAFAKHAIESSAEHLSPAGAEERDYFEHHGWGQPDGARLSCAACVLGDVLVTVPPESQARKQIIRKSATERAITIDPVLRQVYVEVEPHRLGERKGDWERLQDVLRAEWGWEELRIDIHGKQRVTVTVWDDAEVIDVLPGYYEGLYGLAVDVGSTTIAVHLCDLRTGEVLATESMMNPQVTYGEDLMSRVSYAMMHDDGLAKMHQAIVAGLNKLAGLAAHAAGLLARNIHEIVIAGNTVMHHILLGFDPTDLGAAPFTLATHAPIDIKARDLGLKLHPGANVHFLPLEAGHVGSDNVGVLIAEAPDQQDELMLLIDIGTNAEIVLGDRTRLQSCSSPTGPAFEGAQIAHGQRAAPGAIERVRIDRATGEPRFKVIGKDAWSDQLPPEEIGATGICGSGIIEVVAELFTSGLLRFDGRFNSEWLPKSPDKETRRQGEEEMDGSLSPGLPVSLSSRMRWNGPKAEYILATAEQTATGREIVVTQDDVRNIQLAKAALYTGCKLLMQRRGVEQVDKIVLAGAFGSYIDPLHAMILGLYPDCALDKVYAVGNAAGDGARIALLSKARRREAAALARRVEYIETAIDPDFQSEFVRAMHLPHMTDTFPHLEELGALPARQAPSTDDRRARRRERRERSQSTDRTD